jgi:hypothetical protein
VNAQASRGPIVIDTDVFGADLNPRSRLAQLYEPVIVGRPAFVSFQANIQVSPDTPKRPYKPLTRGFAK